MRGLCVSHALFWFAATDVTVSIVLPWTKEKALGLLKRQGKIASWGLDKDYSEGNKRRYLVTVDIDTI